MCLLTNRISKRRLILMAPLSRRPTSDRIITEALVVDARGTTIINKTLTVLLRAEVEAVRIKIIRAREEAQEVAVAAEVVTQTIIRERR